MDKTFQLTKFCNVYTTRDLNSPDRELLAEESKNALAETESIGFERLLKDSTKAWQDQVWDAAPIGIESADPVDQLVVDFA